MYLTKRQRQMLDCIGRFIDENGYSPTLEEIGGKMGLSSPATVHKHLQNLEAKGQIRRNWNHSRSVELIGEAAEGSSRSAPLLGYVAAGSPIEAIENQELIDIPREFVRSKKTFVLRVKGESMIEDGIHDGDLIIVEQRSTAEPAQTVVALIDGSEATVKRFYPQGAEVRLEPANAAMEAMTFPAESVRIQGVVIGLMRKYS
ncbi:transcriptional repressor LexA [Candidatus Sumerlaeota bacterium]|nr:transcriptional repressor LexA [Candidatus Sumerlaeota bacterium]